MIDRQDVRMIVKGVVLMVSGSSVLIATAGALGLAWRVFTMMAG
jgi:hypothetical protein